MTREEIKNASVDFAKRIKKTVAKDYTDPEKFLPSKNPISLFMAGSPGAGKTEYSKQLLKVLDIRQVSIIRIDGDDLRNNFPEYSGKNSYLFQAAISILIDHILDRAYKQKQSFILDGTFSHLKVSKKNIDRSLKNGHEVIIFYIYQDPEIAWRFTKARESIEGRKITKTTFIEEFFAARETLDAINKKYMNKISIFLVEKDIEPRKNKQIFFLSPGETIDQYIPDRYTVSVLKKLL